MAKKRKWDTDSGNRFEGQVNVCCHYVNFRYWGFKSKLTPELEDYLTEAAEERAQDCIIKGCHSGELCALYCKGDSEEEIRGWFEIDRS